MKWADVEWNEGRKFKSVLFISVKIILHSVGIDAQRCLNWFSRLWRQQVEKIYFSKSKCWIYCKKTWKSVKLHWNLPQMAVFWLKIWKYSLNPHKFAERYIKSTYFLWVWMPSRSQLGTIDTKRDLHYIEILICHRKFSMVPDSCVVFTSTITSFIFFHRKCNFYK